MKPAILLTDALTDRELFGRTFGAASFWTWIVVAKLIDGLPLTEPEFELYKQCTGRSRLPNRRERRTLRRLIILVGRRGGKDRFLSAVGVWRAALCADWRKHLSAGEQASVLLLGADRRQAAILRRYCEGLLTVPLLAREVMRRTDDAVEFRNGAVLEVATNNAALVRGRSAIAVLGSECCHWRTADGSNSDEEVVGASEPSMAMCPDGGLLMLGSSVHRKRGYMYRQFKKLHGNNDGDDICWFAPSRVMNPRLPEAVETEALANDAPRARAEFLNVWREDVDDFCPLDVLEAVTDFGVRERPPRAGIRYVAYADAAGGTGTDSYALAIGHAESDGTLVLDVLRERKPRFVPAALIAGELAPLLRAYRVGEVEGDAYASGFHADEYAQNRIRYKACETTTSENYLRALPLLLAGRSRLIDHPALRNQISSLERTLLPSGGEKVTHPKVASAHDDLAAAALGVLAMLARAPRPIDWASVGPEIVQMSFAASRRGLGERATAMARRARGF